MTSDLALTEVRIVIALLALANPALSAGCATPNEAAALRTAVIQQGGPQIPIDYSMEKTDTGWKVYDVVIDGASLVTTYRGTFNDQIQRGGIDGLVKTLQERNRSPDAAKT